MMKINSSQTDWILFRNVTSGNRITFDYNISAKPRDQWWVLYRGVMPDWANLNENKEKWDWVFSNSKTDRKGKVQFDYEFTPGAIYTLALFKDQTKDAYDLADYFEFCVPPQDHKLYDRKISGNTTTFYYRVDSSIEGSGIIDEQKEQWWALYRGVMPHWANLNKNKEKWARAVVPLGRISPVRGKVQFDYEFTPGAIYTLALFKDQTENAYDLADYMEFCVQPQDDNLSHLKISGNTIEFDYNISAEPSSQWWVLYRGVIPDWANLNENKEKWDRISSNSKTDRKGTVQFDYECTPGAIYTLALFKDQTEDAYDLAYYLEFLGGEQDNSADPSGWIELHGDNSYCYCACSSAGDNKQKHDSNKTMNVKEGAPYLYAVLTKDDDSIDFPTDAVLTIEGPDGTKYDRDIQEENQLVIMSDSSIRCLIIKDPKPGDWKMTMTVPEGVGFHCECNTVPSKDPYKTITTTLSKTNQLQKRGSSKNHAAGWTALAGILTVLGGVALGVGTIPLILGASIVMVVTDYRAAPGQSNVATAVENQITEESPSQPPTTAMATALANTAQASSTATPTPVLPNAVRVATWNVYPRTIGGTRPMERILSLLTETVRNDFDIVVFQEVPQSLLSRLGVNGSNERQQMDNVINNANQRYEHVIMDREYPAGTTPARSSTNGYLIVYNTRTLRLTLGASFYEPNRFLEANSPPYVIQARPPVEVQFNIIQTNTNFGFYTWHAEAPGALTNTYPVTLYNLLQNQGGHWMIAGDLNVVARNLPSNLGTSNNALHHYEDGIGALDHVISDGTVNDASFIALNDPRWDQLFFSDAHYVLFARIEFS